VKPGTVILNKRANDVRRLDGLPVSALIEVGNS
jgi:hypothetical protein